MIGNFLLIVFIIFVFFLIYVVTRKSKFKYEKSTFIKTTPDKIFPYISNFKYGLLWNSFDQKDPNTQRTFIGNDAEVGSKMEFKGNTDAGSGYLQILSLTANSEVQMRLVMTKPIPADNLIVYKLNSESDGTKFTWSMSGDGGFIGQLVNVFIDCEKMIVDEFDKSFDSLKRLVEEKSE